MIRAYKAHENLENVKFDMRIWVQSQNLTRKQLSVTIMHIPYHEINH